MSPGNCDRSVIIRHELSEELCAGKHGNLTRYGFHKLRIAPVDRCGIDNTVDAVSYIFGTLSVVDQGAFAFQMFCDGRLMGI